MPDFSETQDCLFCQINSSPAEDLEWYDRPLAHIAGAGGVIAGLGAFVPGYVLIFPDMHVESTLAIPNHFSAAFSGLVRSAVEAVSAEYGPVTVFEHGSCTRRYVRRSACLSHAHVHVLPGSYELSCHLTSVADQSKNHTPTIERLERSGYLFLKEPSGRPLYGIDPGVSQFFRRRIAEELDIPDKWDYLMYPYLENVRETIHRLSGLLL